MSDIYDIGNRVVVNEPGPTHNIEIPRTGRPIDLLDNSYYQVIESIAKASEDTESVYAEYDKARMYARIYDVPESLALEMMDYFDNDFFGKRPDVKTAPKAIFDSIDAGVKTIELAMLYSKLSGEIDVQAMQKSISESYGDIAGTVAGHIVRTLSMRPQDILLNNNIDDIKADIARIEKEMEPLTTDIVPRWATTGALKAIGQAAPYSLYFAAVSGAGAIGASALSAINPAASGIAAVQTMKTISIMKAFLSTAMPAATSAKIMQGLDYKEFIEGGGSHEQAVIWSNIGAFAKAMIEQAIGIEGSITSLITGNEAGNIVQRWLSKVSLTGGSKAAGRVASLAAKRYAANTIGETIEETSQDFITGLTLALAQTFTENDATSVIDKETLYDIAYRVSSGLVDNLVVSAGLSVPMTVAMSIKDKSEIDRLKKVALTMDSNTFESVVSSSGVMEGADDQLKHEFAIAIRNKSIIDSKKVLDDMKKAESEMTTKSNLLKGVSRDSYGNLRTNSEVVADDENSVTVEYTYGSASSSDVYGRFTVRREGNNAIIEDGIIEQGFEGLSDEMIMDIASKNRGLNLIASESGVSIDLEVAIKNSQDIGLSSNLAASIATVKSNLDEGARDWVRMNLSKVGFINDAQREIGVSMFQMLANFKQVPFHKIKDEFAEDFINMNESDVLAENNSVGAASVAGAAKAIIYMAENANFSTFIHEFLHIVRTRFMDGTEDLSKLEEAYSIENGMWSKDNEEQFVNDFMGLMSNYEMGNEKAKPIMARIASWLKNLWKGAISNLNVDSRIRDIFNKFVSASDAEPVEVGNEQGLSVVSATEQSNEPNVVINEDAENSEESIEFKKQLGLSSDDLLFMPKDQVKREEYIFPEAKDYKSAREWAEQYGEWDKFTQKDRDFFTAAWTRANSGIKPKFARSGSFTRYIVDNGLLNDLIERMYKSMYTNLSGSDTEFRTRVARIRNLIASSPEMMRIIDKRKKNETVNKIDRNILIGFIRRNESIMKLVYGELAGSQELIDEALFDQTYIPPLKSRKILTKPGKSIREMQEQLNRIRNKALRAKIDSGKITSSEIREYIDNIKIDEKDRSKKKLSEYREKIAERKALAKMLARMKKLREYILTPGTGMRLEDFQVLNLIQQYLTSGGDTDSIKAAGSYVFQRNPKLLASVVDMLESLRGNDFKNWNLSQLEEMADIIESLVKVGRYSYRQEELERGMAVKATRSNVSIGLKTKPDFIQASEFATEGFRENQKKQKIKEVVEYPFVRMDVFASHFLDGGSNSQFSKADRGYGYDLLVNRAIEAQTAKLGRKTERTREVKQFLDKNKLYEHLGEQITIKGVGYMGRDIVVTKDDLIGIHLLIGTENKYNKLQREAFIYGVLFDPGLEKGIGTFIESGTSYEKYNQLMMDKYEDKLKILLEAVDDNMDAYDRELARLMAKEFASKSTWARFANAVIKLSNKEPEAEKFYFPMYRVGVIENSEDSIQDAIKSSGVFDNFMNTGMMIERNKYIQPRLHKPIRYRATEVFFDAIEHQEHLINFGEYAKLLHSVFLNNDYSQDLRDQIVANLGAGGFKYIEDYIKLVTNPTSFEPKDAGTDVVGFFRGAMVIWNLAWRWSSVAIQMMTSPLPFLSEVNPAEMMEVASECVSSGHPIDWYRKIESKSPILANRQMDIVIEQLEAMNEGTRKKIGQMGMKGLEFADRVSVAIGWEAVYRHRLRADKRNVSENEKAYDAARYADRVVINTQPSADPLYRAPIYRNKSVAWQLLLQFTQPMNVIWQNIRYDMPEAFAEKRWHNFFGFLAAYSLSGMAVGVMRAVRGNGPEDPEEWWKYLLHSSVSQYMEAVPLAGEVLSSLTRSMIMGENMYMSDRNLPALFDAANAVYRLSKGDLEEAAIKGFSAIGLGVAIPGRALTEAIEMGKNIQKAISE